MKTLTFVLDHDGVHAILKAVRRAGLDPTTLPDTTKGARLLDDNAMGVHFDLFTIQGDGKLNDPTDMVKAFAPFSHDAQAVVPEPTSLVLLGLGLTGAGVVARRKRKSERELLLRTLQMF